MAEDNLIPFDPEKASQKAPKSPELADECIKIVGALSSWGHYLETIAGHMDELDGLLYEANDFIGADKSSTYHNVIGAAGYLLPEFAENIRHVAEKLNGFTAVVNGSPASAEEGGAR